MILNGPGFGGPLPNALKVIGPVRISTAFVAKSLPELSGRSRNADGELLTPAQHAYLPGMHMPFLASTLKLSNRKKFN